MTLQEHTIREATPDDATALAELINFAGEGMPLYLWSKRAEPGQSPWDVGRARARRTEGGFSYRNAFVCEIDSKIAAMLLGYSLPDDPVPIGPDMSAMFVPLQELENLAPGSWYINVLAAYPEHRGMGLGTRLLDLAEDLARKAGHGTLSIIVSDANAGARRLYEKCGYTEIASRPLVMDDWINPGKNWVLLTKALAD